jgi:signal transduction histidine kinase
VGEVQLADEADRKWTTSETEIVQATMANFGQHIENLRLLAQAERYRGEAEQVSRRLTNEGWREYLGTRTELGAGYLYDQNQVQPLNGNGHNGSTPALSYPLVVRDEPIGELMLETADDAQAYTTELVVAVAEQLSDHIENLRLLEQAEQKRLELETVATVSSTASTVLDPDKLLQAVVDLSKERFGLYHAHIYLADNSWQTLLLASGAGEIGRKMVAEEHSIPMDAEKSLVARALRERQSIIANDVRSQPDFLANPYLPDTRAEMAIPMIVGDKVLGVFDVQSNKSSGFTKEDANIYTTLASQVAVALQNARLYVEQAATVTQLRELDRLKSSFLANMSHELRTPLNSILGFTDVMLEGLDGDLTEYMDNDLRLIQKNGQHLLHLINDVLDMAKIESGRMNLHLEKFKIHSILDEVTSITSTLASEKNLALFIEEDSDQEIEIFADNTRLRQVMINLVNNSIKFTEKGKIALRASQLDGARILITIKDTGIGIPPEQLEDVFHEFTQVDTSTTRKVGGTGLGLPISRRLIEMHGGRLWAESTGVSGEGSTFFVELPVEARITEVIEKQEK